MYTLKFHVIKSPLFVFIVEMQPIFSLQGKSAQIEDNTK